MPSMSSGGYGALQLLLGFGRRPEDTIVDCVTLGETRFESGWCSNRGVVGQIRALW